MRKETYKTISIALLSSLLTVLILPVLSPYIGDLADVYFQPPFLDVAYAIGEYNSTHFYAMNASTGNYDYQDRNASYVYDMCRQNMPSNGGIIRFKTGVYNVSNLIIDTDNTFVEGEGQGTVLCLNDTRGSETFIFKVERANDRVEHFGISKMRLNSSDGHTNKKAIYIHGSFKGWINDLVIEHSDCCFKIEHTSIDANTDANRRIWIEGCYFHYIYGWVAYMTSRTTSGTGYNGAIHYSHCWHYNPSQLSGSGGYYSNCTDGGIGLDHCSIHYVENQGIYFVGNGYYVEKSSIENCGESNIINGQRNTIRDNVIQANDKHGLILKGQVNTVTHNFLLNNGGDAQNTYDGLYLAQRDAGHGNGTYGNTITANIARDTNEDRYQRYGINEESGLEDNIIIGNYGRYNNQSDAIHVQTGSQDIGNIDN